MSLISDIAESDIYLSVRYMGKADLSRSWDIQYIADNTEIFDGVFDRYPLTAIQTRDDFFEFCLANKFVRLQETLPGFIDEKIATLIKALAAKATEALNGIKTGSVISFLNSNIRDLFAADLAKYHMRDTVLDIMESYQKGISPASVEWVCLNYGYLVIDRFDNWEKYLEKNPQIFDKMFPTGHLDEINQFQLSKTLKIFSHIYRKEKSILRPTVERAIPTLYDDGKELVESSEGESVLQIENEIEKILCFLKEIRSPFAYEFIRLFDDVRRKVDEHIVKYGHSASYSVPVGEILSKLKAIDQWELRMYALSHAVTGPDIPVYQQSQLAKVTPRKGALIDIASTNYPTDDFFTASQQQDLAITMNVYSGTIHAILHNDEARKDYLTGLASEIHYICDTIESEHDEMEQDSAFLINTIELISANIHSDPAIVHSFCYCASMLLCALAEKLMRKAYVHSVREMMYVPAEKATMGDLLNPNNKEMREIFGENHLQNLAFFFIRTEPNKIGKNIRNSLAHWAGVGEESLKQRND